MRPAELFAHVADVPLPVAATRFAQAGVPVFPCVPGGKRPVVEGGFHAASSDPAQIDRLVAAVAGREHRRPHGGCLRAGGGRCGCAWAGRWAGQL